MNRRDNAARNDAYCDYANGTEQPRQQAQDQAHLGPFKSFAIAPPMYKEDGLGALHWLVQGHPKDTKLTFGAAAWCISLICLMNGQELSPIADNYNPSRDHLACYGCVLLACESVFEQSGYRFA